MTMETFDVSLATTLPLSVIYDYLHKLDSMESKVNDQIKYLESTILAVDGASDSSQKLLLKMKQVRDQVGSMHGSLRKAANANSRFGIRSLNILDLPDELFRAIFKHARNRSSSDEIHFFIPDSDNLSGLKDIKERSIDLPAVLQYKFSPSSSPYRSYHVFILPCSSGRGSLSSTYQ